MKKISMEEVRKHNKRNDIWIVVDKKVYDVTKYVNNVILWRYLRLGIYS